MFPLACSRLTTKLLSQVAATVPSDKTIVSWSGIDTSLDLASSSSSDDADVLSVVHTLGNISVTGSQQLVVEVAVESLMTTYIAAYDDDNSGSGISELRMQVQVVDADLQSPATTGLPGPLVFQTLQYDLIHADDYTQVRPSVLAFKCLSRAR
jgi:hypothetical protein